MILQRPKTFLVLLLLVSSQWSCDRGQPNTATQVWEKEDTIDSTLLITELPALKLDNYFGGFIINGHTNKNTIHARITRRAKTQKRDNLDAMLESITFHIHQQDDTVYAHIEAPPAQRNEQYSASINIFIPYDMPVYIDWSKSAVITNELDSLVFIRNAKSRVLLARHRGSADVEAQSHINLEIYKLWRHGFINAVTDSGDVNMVLPKTAHATIFAKSFYNPIELVNIELARNLTSHFTVNGILGEGDAPIHLETTFGIVRIKQE